MNERIKFDWREIELISAHSLARATKPRIAHESDESRSSLWAERKIKAEVRLVRAGRASKNVPASTSRREEQARRLQRLRLERRES